MCHARRGERPSDTRTWRASRVRGVRAWDAGFRRRDSRMLAAELRPRLARIHVERWDKRPAPRLPGPVSVMEKKSRQRIRYLHTADGVRLAWAEAGDGPRLVKASNWLTHLEYDWESPVWRHWVRFLADHFHAVRYDERGCGMTDWNVAGLSYERWVEDLEAVADTAARDATMILLGIAQGAAVYIDYAVLHACAVSYL